MSTMLPGRVLHPITIWLAVAAGSLMSQTTRAGNGGHPRTPVIWPADPPCMTVIDRSKTTMLHFGYEIPYEDIDVTPDEVADSRRHQFIALCSSYSPQDPPPRWLSWKDVDAAAAKGLLDPMGLTDEDVLETSSIYKDCFTRITADTDRRAITHAEATKGFDWDVAGLMAGPYTVQGYTWEPAFNFWWPRPGVMHVVDGDDLAMVPPAAALTNQEDFMFGDETLALQGCARAIPGSTVSGYWSLTGPTLDWQLFAEGVALADDVIALSFTPPPAAIQQTVALRVDVTDPMKRSFSAYPIHLLTILPGSGGTTTTGCGDSGSFIGGECGSSGSGVVTSGGATSSDAGTDGANSSSGSSSATGPKMDDDPTPTGCACTASGTTSPWVMLMFFAFRRRPRLRLS